MGPDPERVAVVGGGIGGLATALALSRAGVAVTVFERGQEPSAAGGAIQIWTNGMLALERLGLADLVREHGSQIERQVFRTLRGTSGAVVPVGALARDHGLPPPVMLTRGDLLEVLLGAIPPGTVELGAELARFEEDGSGVTLTLADGRLERASVLVGADGIESSIRQTLFPDSRPRPQGYQYLRCLARFEGFPPGEFHFLLGRGDRFGVHDVAPGQVYWFGVVVAGPGSPSGKQELRERFREFPAPVTELIEAADENEIGRVDIRDVDPLDRWVDGRVALLGDAAHAMTPNLGRGAGEALEDAVGLAEALGEAGRLREDAVATALRGYDETRRLDATAVQRRSRKLGGILGWRNPMLVRVRGRVVGKVVARTTRREFGAARPETETSRTQMEAGDL